MISSFKFKGQIFSIDTRALSLLTFDEILGFISKGNGHWQEMFEAVSTELITGNLEPAAKFLHVRAIMMND